MPIYEYECTACGHRFELIQKFSDDPAKACVRCGEPVNKLFSRSAVHFKGTGWYVTDYAAKNTAGSANKSDGEGKKESEKVSTDSGSTGKDAASTSAATTPKADQ
ncbi:MAG: zinc ribbon domain-containing protein [Acidobacteria bacterium]|nr:zinc ribbon domain-containing protein [Acidobacteriota bacterium]